MLALEQVWLFNPAVRVSFSTASAAGSLLHEESSQDPARTHATGARQVTRTLNAVKVFYTVVEDEPDPQWCVPRSLARLDRLANASGSRSQEFITSPHSTTERIAYPLNVTTRLTELLRASSAVYPLGKRMWGDMEAGFLERI